MKNKLKALGAGKATVYKQTYDASLLEVIPNEYPEQDLTVELEAFEFSCLCPVTGQPDQGAIHIRYIPQSFLVESKSLKLYLFSFRNEGTFHEAAVKTICRDLDQVLKNCRYLEVFGRFHSRGGIAIYPRSIICRDEAFKKIAMKRKLMLPFQSTD